MSIQKSAVSILAIVAAVGLTACSVLDKNHSPRNSDDASGLQKGHAEVTSDSRGLSQESQLAGTIKEESLPKRPEASEKVKPSPLPAKDELGAAGDADLGQNGSFFLNCVRSNFADFDRQNAESSFHLTEIISIFNLNQQPCAGQAVILVSQDGSVLLWDLSGSRAYNLLKIPYYIKRVAFHEGKKLLAVASGSRLEIYSILQKKPIASLRRLSTNITSLDFNPDGLSVVAGGADSDIFRWKYVQSKNFNSLRERDRSLERYVGHSTVISAIEYHPQGRVFFSGDWNGMLTAWFNYDADPFAGQYDEGPFGPRFFTERPSFKLGVRQLTERIDNLIVSQDGQQIILTLRNGMVEVWRVRGFIKAGEKSAHQGLIYSVALSPDSTSLVTAGRDGWLRVWKIEEKDDRSRSIELVSEKELQLSGVSALTFLDNNTILVVDRNGAVVQLAAFADQKVIKN